MECTSNTRSRRTCATTRSSARWTRRGSASCGSRSAIAGLLVLVLLFSAWQHFELLRHGYQVEELQRAARRRGGDRPPAAARDRDAEIAAADRGAGDAAAAPGRRPRRDEAIVIERVLPADPPAASVVARAVRRSMTTSRDRRPTHDWRPIMTRRVGGRRRRCSGCGSPASRRSSSTCRSSSTPIWSRAPSASRSARSRRRPSAATSSIAAAACSRPASTPTPSTRCRPRSTTPRDAAKKICEALRDCDGEGSAGARRAARRSSAPSPTCAARSRPIRRERVAALNLDGIGFIKESKRFYPNKELAAHLLGWVGIDNNGLSGLESTYDPQIRGKAGTVLVHTDARRHAFSRVERPPTTGSSIELTIDEYLQHIAERELHAGVAREPRRRRHARSS